MTEFVRFKLGHDGPDERFEGLCALFEALKLYKNSDDDRPLTEYEREVDDGVELNPAALRTLLPDAVVRSFDWPEATDPNAERISGHPVRIQPAGRHSGERWSFARVTELIQMCDYEMESCERTETGMAELRVLAGGWPFGGLNALIALVEGFGFLVVGYDEGFCYAHHEPAQNP